MVELVTPSEYARRRAAAGKAGGTPAAVSKAIEAGRITVIRDDEGRVRIDPDVADIQWERNTRKRADLHSSEAAAADPPPDKPAPGAAWGDSKAREQAAKAELLEIELAEKKSELIDRAGYERAAMQTHRQLRDALVDVLPAKLAPELAGMAGDSWAIECRLRAAVRETLAAVAGQWKETAAAMEESATA